MFHLNSFTRVFIVVFSLAFLTSQALYAHCGKCGMGDEDHSEKAAGSESSAAAHFDAKLDKMNAKAATLEEASAALKDSHPELSTNLQAMAADERKWIEEKKEWKKRHSAWAKEHADLMSSHEGHEH